MHSRPIVIAHRGASGYLPEHTEGAKVLAHAQGADYLEQDTVLSRDGVLVVSHDLVLEHTTDVQSRFPERQAEDGHFYFADFDWAELRSLAVHQRSAGSATATRFPNRCDQRLLCLEDEIQLIQGLNYTLGREAGLHIELKAPAWHLARFGYHMADKLIPILDRFGYRTATDLCFIQCFEPDELQYLREHWHCSVRLIQLLGNQPLALSDADRTTTTEPTPEWKDSARLLANQLEQVRTYADGIGPSLELLAEYQAGQLVPSELCVRARQLGLDIHPYTVRADRLPPWAPDLDTLHHFLLEIAQVQGFFTDFPDLARMAIDLRPAAAPNLESQEQ